MPYGVASQKDQEEYAAARVKLELAEAACQYCKRNKQGRCRKHAQLGYLTFATSPVSEAYWAS